MSLATPRMSASPSTLPATIISSASISVSSFKPAPWSTSSKCSRNSSDCNGAARRTSPVARKLGSPTPHSGAIGCVMSCHASHRPNLNRTNRRHHRTYSNCDRGRTSYHTRRRIRERRPLALPFLHGVTMTLLLSVTGGPDRYPLTSHALKLILCSAVSALKPMMMNIFCLNLQRRDVSLAASMFPAPPPHAAACGRCCRYRSDRVAELPSKTLLHLSDWSNWDD